MTGQVKEEIITRLGELGVFIRDGHVHFHPVLLRRSEFVSDPDTFEYFDVSGTQHTLTLKAQELAFTYCQVPIVYRISEKPQLTLHLADGTIRNTDGLVMDEASSREIFRRSGTIVRVEVALTPGLDN